MDDFLKRHLSFYENRERLYETCAIAFRDNGTASNRPENDCTWAEASRNSGRRPDYAGCQQFSEPACHHRFNSWSISYMIMEISIIEHLFLFLVSYLYMESVINIVKRLINRG